MRNIAKLLSICSILLTDSLFAQNINRTGFIKDSIDAYVNRALTNWRIPGAAVCIVKDGKVILMKGYGVKELGLNNKVDDRTLFMIGSNTKAFTATALASNINDVEKAQSRAYVAILAGASVPDDSLQSASFNG